MLLLLMSGVSVAILAKSLVLKLPQQAQFLWVLAMSMLL